MKKVLMSIFGVVVLAGCSSSYDYYQGGVAYTQDGPDCIYAANEAGNRFSDKIISLEGDKKIVYRNTLCSDLYNKDTSGQAMRRNHAVFAPVSEVPQMKCTSGCGSCGQVSMPVLKRRYVIVPVI